MTERTDYNTADGQAVIDLNNSTVMLTNAVKTREKKCTEINDETDWDGDDITMITAARQQAHIHSCGGSEYVLIFPRDIQGTTAMMNATAQERKDDDTYTDGGKSMYEMALRRLRHIKQLNDEVIDTYMGQICA